MNQTNTCQGGVFVTRVGDAFVSRWKYVAPKNKRKQSSKQVRSSTSPKNALAYILNANAQDDKVIFQLEALQKAFLQRF